MDSILLQKAVEYAVETIIGVIVAVVSIVFLYQKLVIEEDSTWRFWSGFILMFVLLVIFFYILLSEGVL